MSAVAKLDTELLCLRCGHGSDPARPWRRRTVGFLPRQCPACHSIYWNEPRRRPANRVRAKLRGHAEFAAAEKEAYDNCE